MIDVISDAVSGNNIISNNAKKISSAQINPKMVVAHTSSRESQVFNSSQINPNENVQPTLPLIDNKI